MASVKQTEAPQSQVRQKRFNLNALIKKIHMYTGLLSFTVLFVFGIAGLDGTFDKDQQARLKDAVERTVPYTVPPNATDKAVADDAFRILQVPLAGQVPQFALRRDAEKNLTFAFYTPNGPTFVTVLHRENLLRVRTVRHNFWKFANNLHETTIQGRSEDLRIKLWTYYNEFSIWALIFMALSGVYLWLSSRPAYRPAQYAFAAGCGIFILLYSLTR